jgi:signal transduction histidine kinase
MSAWTFVEAALSGDMPDPDNPQHGSRSEPVLSAELQERSKELSFLHHVTRLIHMRGEPRDILRAALELLPSAMQHPELACARLSLGTLEISTRGYASSNLNLLAEFDADGSSIGFVEVCYAPASGAASQPCFLAEERLLLVSFAQLLKGFFERTRACQRLLQVEAAEQSALSENRAKDQFLSNVSHELRSSLHVMLGWIQLLREGSASPDVTARGLEILQRNVSLQAKLIEDLMDLSRIISGKLELECRRLDLAELIGFAVDAIRPAADAKQLQLSAELEPVGHVIADQQRLQQVVYNLLGNAVKFTPAGGRVHVGLTRQGSMARILVQDTGVGIDSALLPHVFERFRQAESAQKGRTSGLGLGLPIARHLVELHHGAIVARSRQPEPGTTFEITLPLEA